MNRIFIVILSLLLYLYRLYQYQSAKSANALGESADRLDA